jgi:ribonuclease BN (tRNA processing enzyme)
MNPGSLLSRARQICLLCVALVSPFAAAQDATTARLEVVVLGSGGPGATGRAGSSHLVLLDGVPRILVDAGPGSFARLGEARLSLARADIVLLTHLHVDHVGELPGLFKARAVSTRGDIAFRVFGPAGHRGAEGDANFPSTRAFIDLLFGEAGAFSYLPAFSAPMTITASDVGTSRMQTLLSEDGLVISAVAGHHRDAPAVIYRVDYAGRSVTFSGDVDAEGLAGLRQIARGSSLLVFNSVVLDPPGSPPVLYTLHSPPAVIGEVARDAAVGSLLLAHLAPAVEHAHDDVRASIARSFAGKVTFAKDGMRMQP